MPGRRYFRPGDTFRVRRDFTFDGNLYKVGDTFDPTGFRHANVQRLFAKRLIEQSDDVDYTPKAMEPVSERSEVKETKKPVSKPKGLDPVPEDFRSLKFSDMRDLASKYTNEPIKNKNGAMLVLEAATNRHKRLKQWIPLHPVVPDYYEDMDFNDMRNLAKQFDDRPIHSKGEAMKILDNELKRYAKENA